MSSASVDFKFFLDTHPSGAPGAQPQDRAYWSHVWSMTWACGGQGATPAFELRVDLYPNGAPDLMQQIVDADRLIASATDPQSMIDAVVDIYGASVRDAMLAICMDPGDPPTFNEYAEALGWHMQTLRMIRNARRALCGGCP